MEPETPQRLRPHPEDRFAGTHHRFDLSAAAAHLAGEAERLAGEAGRVAGEASGIAGHRQQTLYKHGPTSLALFLFAAGTRLPPHRTSGTVIIQVLKGRLTVNAGGQANELAAGSLIVLEANLEHDVAAHEASEMLLTVHLDAKSAPGEDPR